MTENDDNRTCSTRAAEPRFPLARRGRASGFTLVELLLVIAVIGILSGLLFNGVFSVTKQANEKRNESNRQLLQAAIMEYRHDVGKWPVPDADASGTSARTEEYVDADTAKVRKKVVWQLTYGQTDSDGNVLGGNNDVVVERLLNGRVGSKDTKKNYLDLRTFLTTENGDEKKYLSDETAETMSAFEAHRNGSESRKAGKNIPLVYRSTFVKCPVCESIQTESAIRGKGGFCTALGCHDAEAHPDVDEKLAPPHFFEKGEIAGRRVNGALPYKITFDFVNNTCSVTL